MSALPLSTDKKHYKTVHLITGEMLKCDLPVSFVERARRLAIEFEGGFDLLMLWHETTDQDEKDSIIADIREEIDEMRDNEGIHGSRPLKRPKINFDDIEDMGTSIVDFKKRLRRIVDNWGGVPKLAKAIDMSPPSLYRFFNSASIPRKTTLYKIANALDLDEKDIAFEYTK